MADLVVYGTPVSPFVRKVEAVLRPQVVAYEFENTNLMEVLGKLVPQKLICHEGCDPQNS